MFRKLAPVKGAHSWCCSFLVLIKRIMVSGDKNNLCLGPPPKKKKKKKLYLHVLAVGLFGPMLF